MIIIVLIILDYTLLLCLGILFLNIKIVKELVNIVNTPMLSILKIIFLYPIFDTEPLKAVTLNLRLRL